MGNADESWLKVKDILDRAQEECVPSKRRRAGNKPLWMNGNIMRVIRKKRRLWKSYKLTKDYQQYVSYKHVEKEVRNAVKRAKRKFERKLAKNSKKNPKAFYRYLNSQTSNRKSVGPLKTGDQIIADDTDMATLLNSFFSSIFTEEDLSILPEPKVIYNGDSPIETVEFIDSDIKQKIKKLKTSSAAGPDKIGPRLLQELSDIISYPLSVVYTKSLAEGYVPSDWKSANITPIFKKGSKYSVGNYRPISLTSIVCKIMESILRDKIMLHIASHNIINSSQHGFLPKKSCLTNLLEYMEALTKLVDEGHSVDVVYLDFAKAFDSVPHQRLLAKLKAVGIDGKLLLWISAWLTCRKQRVVLNGKCSEWVTVRSGVPQGSVLGPILFLLYINDIDGSDAMHSLIFKFADDCKLVRKVNTVEDAEIMQAAINGLFQWSIEWQMLFNASKCKVLHFGKNNPIVSYTMDGYAPGGTVLENVDVEKDLGVLVHTSLKPSVQCAAAVKKANSVLGQMARTFSYRDKVTWTRLYQQYVRPHLEYAIQSWNPWTVADTELLESVQKRAINMIPGLTGLYEQKLMEVGLTTLVERRSRGDMIEVWKILHGKEDVDFKTWFSLVDDYHSRTTRLSDSLILAKPKAKLDIRKYFFSHRVVDRWNALPYKVKNADCLDTFKCIYDSLFMRL